MTASVACAGLDAAFHLVQLLYGREVALRLSFINEHRWLEDPATDPLIDLYENSQLKGNAVDIHDGQRKDQTDPKSFIHLSYRSSISFETDEEILLIACLKSSIVVGD